MIVGENVEEAVWTDADAGASMGAVAKVADCLIGLLP
jgi:hypothetical protein